MTETPAHTFRPEERPLFPGSPFSPAHSTQRRLTYFVAALAVGATATFGNALTTVNVGTIAGSLGLYVAEASVLPAIYVAMNASANLTLVKARAQFGIPAVTGGLLVAYALSSLVQLAFPGFAAAILIRAVDGLTAAALTTITIYYLVQAFPAKIRPLGLVIGMGLPQLGTPLARLVPVDLLATGQWWGLHMIELALALGTLALLIAVPLPPSERSKAFEPLDLVSITLATAAMLLVCQVIGLGRVLWWTDAPQLGVMLALAIPLFATVIIIEGNRARPLLRFEWVGTIGILRFAAVALLVRLALAEQTFSAVGLLTAGGLDNDQLRTLFAVVTVAMLLGIVAAALTLSERRLPYQALAAALIIAVGAWMDSGATSLTRPEQLYLSQALIGFGTTLFVGPALVYGFLQMIQRGGDHLATFIVLFSSTQNVGGLMGSALFGSLQTIWTRDASNVFAGQLVASDPQVIARLTAGSGAVAGAIIDPAQRAGQGGALLGQVMAREASVIAYDDTFRFVFILAIGTAIFLALNIAIEQRRRQRREQAA